MSGKQCKYDDCYELYDDLVRHLSEGGKVVEITQQFFQLQNNADRVEFAYDLLKEYKPLPTLIEDRKSDAIAANFRREGNEHFKFKRNQRALEFYTRSVAYAENESEALALAYANRSAVLFDEELYEECLMDIQRALDGRYPDHLKPKLESRRQKCLSLKNKGIKIQFHLAIPKIIAEQQNKHIQCATNAIKMVVDPEQGRHVIATRNIHIGEVLVVEKSFCNLILDKFSIHCHECLQLCYNLIPCLNCSEAMYCSDMCRSQAYTTYHRHECKVLKTFRLLDDNKLDLLPLKVLLSIRDKFDEISKIGSSCNDGVYRSDRYDEVHRLEGNTSKRSVSDLFKRSVIAALIFHVIHTYTDVLPTDRDQEIFKELLLKHMQTSANNFHEISEMTKSKNGVYEPSELAAGVYPMVSMFNHSCCPNVLRESYGSTQILRAMRTIKKGEQCYDNYGCHYAIMNKEERQKKMKRQYLFDCKCRACQEEWPLYKDLPRKQHNITWDDVNLEKLEKGDREYAKEILPQMVRLLSKLEKFEPEVIFAEVEEMTKQCYSLMSNVRRSFKVTE